MATCYRCGDDGHSRRDCPAGAQLPAAASGPAAPAAGWCGECDRRTRLIDRGTSLTRCASCHPQRNDPLGQHLRCGGCRRLVYAWDRNPCGSHQELAVLAKLRTP